MTNIKTGLAWPSEPDRKWDGIPGLWVRFLSWAGMGALLLGLQMFTPHRLPAEEALGSLEILVGGDMRGEIKPCGCSPEGQIGGLPRRLSFLQEAYRSTGSARRPILLDTGNNFPEPSDQGTLKIALIQRLLLEFPPDGLLPGPNELAMGIEALDNRLAYVVSNDARGEVFPPFRTVIRNGERIGIYGYLSPTEIYQKFSDAYRLEPITPDLIERLRVFISAEGHGRTVLIFRGSDPEWLALSQTGLFDLIVAGNPHDDELDQVVVRQAEGRTIPQVPTKGQGLQRLILASGGQFASSVVWLTDRYPDHPKAVAAFQEYDKAVKALFFARMETMQRLAVDTPFVGSEKCAECHLPAAESWRLTLHAQALTALEKVGKQYDPECVVCHVVGFEKGGYINRDITPGLTDVQCENCHGAGKSHSANPVQNKMRGRRGDGSAGKAEQICRQCHLGSHSPSFDFSVYWPKIAH